MTASHSPTRTDAPLLARTRAGYDLPIIDVTHPSFALADDAASRAARQEAYLADDRQRRRIPGFILRFLIWRFSKKSRLAASLFARKTTYLDGLSTYVMKLGAENLVPPFDSPADQRFAASSHITLLRLRTQQVATLIAEAIATDAAFANDAPLHLVNIAGGPALDSINSLILLKRSHPQLLRRSIRIHVFDRNDDGAFFGANALGVLKQKGNPLEDIDVTFALEDYDWNEPTKLARHLQIIRETGGVVAASSEGGLFEYGSDDAIIANLRILHEAARFVTGSVTSNDEIRRRMIAMSRFKLIARGLDGFRPLAKAAQFTIVKALPAILSDQVLLRPAA